MSEQKTTAKKLSKKAQAQSFLSSFTVDTAQRGAIRQAWNEFKNTTGVDISYPAFYKTVREGATVTSSQPIVETISNEEE